MVISRRERVNRQVIIRWSPNQNHLPSTICFLYTILSYSFFLYCCARDTITVKSLLTDGETLVSAGERFEMGFFGTAETSDIRRYVGIWYYNSNPPVYVWVANRDQPLRYPTGVVAIADDGNLKLLDEKGSPYWNTEVDSFSSPNLVVAKLMDSGNLVLSDGRLGTSKWQSFEHPTDTFLTGMKMDENLRLISWISQDNPGSGNFTFKTDEVVNQYLISKGYYPYWRSGDSGKFFSSDEMPSVITYLLTNFSPTAKPTNVSKFPFNNLTNMSTIDYSNTRLIMNFTGQIQYWSKDKVKGWSLIWGEPRDRCSLINFCGNFGSCNSNNKLECKCLPGFLPKFPENWKSGDFAGGCTRKSENCGENDKFLRLKMMKVGNPDTPILTKNETECLNECNAHCQCLAYSYDEDYSPRRGDPNPAAKCWLWTRELNSLQEEYTSGGRDLYVRTTASDLGSATQRNCETCGTNPIPYPLSTETNCGDPSYFSFHCDNLTGQVSFKALSHTYRVTRINPDTRTFSIQIENMDNCDPRNSSQSLQLNKSLPFSVISWCDAGLGNSSSYISSQAKQEVEIEWALPSEPTCISERDCKNWPHSTCKLSGNRERRCLCNETFQWDPLFLNCTQGSGNTKQEGKKQWNLIVGVTVTVAGVIILSFTIVYFYLRRKVKGRDGESLRQNMAVRFKDSARHVKDLVETDQFREEDKKGIDLPFFDFESILAATDNFSETNKLGKGGFGPVYKGKFPGGEEIAVKRLSSFSGQGLEEFKNEVVLIARLQHRNLVRLLGYCIEGGENILLYEYMPNKSLDSFIFDPTCSVLLDWSIRFNIILGIARGLLYLHQDSRLRIIHRDLKTSNILLDKEMNPKISDFGLAKIFEGKQTEGSTSRVVGTYGYMSPEYALDGFFSVKSDVFSFGVVLLEIVSGKRNTGFYNSEEALSLIGYAWRLWQEDKALDIKDQNLNASSETNEILKCITIGLLCVQEDPNDRPNMSNVVIMLGSESATLPTPRRPAFVISRGPSTSMSSSSTKPETNAKLTVSLVGR